VADGGEAAESENGVLDGLREEKADDEDGVVVAGVVAAVVFDDYEGTAVAGPGAGPVVVAAVAAGLVVVVAVAVYALRALRRENFEGGQLRS
jgi:hypothetical protein